MRRPSAVGLAAIGLVGATAAAGCGSSAGAIDPQRLLAEARATVNATVAAHFELTSQGIPTTGENLRGGSGDLARPDQLRGSFQVSVSGLPVTIKVVVVAGRFWALLPFQARYQVVDPAQFGLGDPAGLLDPATGVSRLLTQLAAARSVGQERINGELLDQVSGTVPGTDVTGFLPDARPSTPVALTFAVDPTTHQVRRVVAVGPFASAGTTSTYVLTLTAYGEQVSISPPG